MATTRQLKDEDVDLQFGRQYRALSTQLKDLSKLLPKAPKLPDEAEDVPDYLEGEIETTQQILTDADDLLNQYNELEKEFRHLFRSLRTKEEQTTAQLWSDNMCTVTGLLDTVALVMKQRREHITILRQCKASLGRAQRQLAQLHPVAAAAPAPATLVTAQFKLPDVPIPTFHGDVMDYKFFCKIFRKRVEDKPIDDEEKFSLLLAHLRGKPLELVKHLPLNTIGYNQAKDRLRRKYGNEDVLVDIITKRIFALRRCSSHDDVRAMFNNADAWLSQLDDVKGVQ